MSKLAAVHTGQPTQGMGTVPTTVSPVDARPFPSPLQAQRAEAAAAAEVATGAATIDDLLEPALTPSTISPRDPYSSVRAAATAAWLSLEAKEIEVRKYFKSIPVASGLEMLAKMRKQCDLAATTLQQRMDEGNQERCTGCGKTLEEVRKTQFLMQGSEVDPETGVPMPYRYCGPQCIRERNREKMLPREERSKLRFDGREMGDVL